MRSSHFSLLTLISLAPHEGYGAAISPRPNFQSHTSDQRRPFKLPQRTTTEPYTLAEYATDPISRSASIAITRAGFLYGPALAGGPFYPQGPVGNKSDSVDLTALDTEEEAEMALGYEDSDSEAEAYENGKFGNLTTLEDYVQLYNNEWTNTMPKGPAAGILTNYTQDLVFSMERLANSPFAVRRLDPSSDSLAFDVEDSLAQNVSGSTLKNLLSAGRLFYADHSEMAALQTNERYAAACDAYFFIDEKSGDFLPLAIRTGVGENLIYTPADEDDDWLLAKMMFNSNDIFFAQFNHLANTHMVVQIAWMAAIRALSVDHPVFAVLDRLTYETFGVQPVAASALFATGAAVDEIFPFSGTTAEEYSNDLYFGESGSFQSNYFLTNLKNRGLINSTFGPELSHFPFYEDASVIYNAMHTFMTSFVDSYYTSDRIVKDDLELQLWATEATGPAEALDFPTSIPDKATLVDILTHIGHLVTSAHHAVNTNQLQSLTMTLPFHPAALYSPIPTTKGITSVVDFLPPFEESVSQIFIASTFSRPLLVGTGRSLIHLFDETNMLNLMNSATRAAAATFMSTMQAFSAEVSARTFDADGLSQGMPFVWQALDPNVAPYSATI